MPKPNRLTCARLSSSSGSAVDTPHSPSPPGSARFSLTKGICFSLIVGSFVTSALPQSTPPDHPNIVIILADDLGYGDVGFNGCPDIATPNIDALANNGVRCTNGYVTHPFCAPSRAALLTGRYQQRFGMENNGLDSDTTNPRAGPPTEEILLPQILKPAGYVCGAVGKWHLGFTPNLHPMQRGFDEFFGFLAGESTYINAQVERDMTHLIETEYLTDAFTREAVSFINRHAAQPFFLYLAYNAVHNPYDQPPATYMDRVANISDPNRRVYAGMLTALDDGVGQVLRTLQAQNLLGKTLIFFLSDNGAPNTGFTRNLPLSGYKFDTLEGGIRVPFAVQWSGRLPGQGIYTDPISSLDIVATAAAVAGVSLPSDRDYDGMNILPVLAKEQASPQRALFWRHFGLGKDGPPGCLETIWAVRNGPLKLVRARATVDQPPSLYDLPNDLGETQDLAASYPGDVDALNQLYAQWSRQLISPLWQRFSDSRLTSLVLAGDWNAFNKADSTLPWHFTRISPPGVHGTPDGLGWLTSTVHVAASGGDTTPGLHSFALIDEKSYRRQWGGVAVKIDDVTSVPFSSGSAFGPTNSISLEDGFFYSFRIINQRQQLSDDLKLAVMKTSHPPVSVTLSGQIPSSPTSNDSVVVSIVTSQSKSTEERIYVRWSTDFFITSHMVEAVGSGQNYSATIPAQPEGTALQYCLSTSTMDLSPFVTSGILDALTLSTSAPSKFVVRGADNLADLKVTVNDSKVTIFAGQKDTYSIVVANMGPDSANGAVIRDNFPTSFTGLTFTATQTGGATGFTASGSGNINDTVNMPAGSAITYKAAGKLSSGAKGSVSNTANISMPAGVRDPNPGNNSATDSDSITLKGDLKVTVSDGKTVANAGAKDTYTIVVSNAGPSDVTGAVIQDGFPQSFTGVSFTATQSGGATGFSASGSGNIKDTVNMPAASKIIYKATGTISVSATGSISDTATVNSGVFDPNTANNTATDTDTL